MNLDLIYEYRFANVDQQKKLAVWNEISTFISEILGHPNRVLDPCAGRCEFINSIKASDKWGVDQEPSLVKYKNDDVKYIVSNIFDADLPLDYFDAIFVSNFLEHLDDMNSITQFFRKMHSVLNEKGKLLIMGPNFKYCFRDYFDCGDHKLPLTHITIEELLYSEHFNLIKVYPKFLPFSFRGRYPASNLLTRFYLKNKWAWNIFGKQFLIIAEKKSSD